MQFQRLRKVGGSVMMAIPPTLMGLLSLRAGSYIRVSVEAGRLVVEPAPPPRYTLAALLSQSDFSAGRSAEELQWLDPLYSTAGNSSADGSNRAAGTESQ